MGNDDAVRTLVAVERIRAADMLAGLDREQWQARSLCEAWTVQELAGHMIMPFRVSVPAMLMGLVKARGDFDSFSSKVSARLGLLPVDELIGILRENAENRFTPPGHGPSAPLTDIVVHTRDVARPLGLDTVAPLGTLRAVLDFLVSAKARRGFVPRGRLDGLRLVATDQNWSHGTGAIVEGPSEALMLAVAGRRATLGDLGGDGLTELRDRHTA